MDRLVKNDACVIFSATLAIRPARAETARLFMRQLLMGLFRVLPLLFGLGFLAPLMAQVIERTGWIPPAGISPLVLGLVVGGLWGGFATIKGRWL